MIFLKSIVQKYNPEDPVLPVFDEGLCDGGEVGGRVGHYVIHRVAQSLYKSLNNKIYHFSKYCEWNENRYALSYKSITFSG